MIAPLQSGSDIPGIVSFNLLSHGCVSWVSYSLKLNLSCRKTLPGSKDLCLNVGICDVMSIVAGNKIYFCPDLYV